MIKKRRKKKISTRMGFEPTRAEHNGLAVHRLNHSATSSSLLGKEKNSKGPWTLDEIRWRLSFGAKIEITCWQQIAKNINLHSLLSIKSTRYIANFISLSEMIFAPFSNNHNHKMDVEHTCRKTQETTKYYSEYISSWRNLADITGFS